ncbi:MAG TPA: hypothetical protein VFF68_00110, partial [Anaerolineaceae bacterium]|nr:hypothetical protein [Anaerolineaceae bacterium]
TATAEPTATATLEPSPTATLEPTVTPLPTETPLPTSTPMPDFAAGQITSVEERGENILWMMALKGLTVPLQAQVGGKFYNCTIEGDYPDRLFCFGPAFSGDPEAVTAAFFPVEGTGTALFEGSYYLPVIIPTPYPPGDPSTWCPERGQDVFCETENRHDIDGNACIVESCFDACGYFYSTDTCPEESWP